MGFGDAIQAGFRQYFTFSGRATRSEYWWFILFLVLASIGCSLLDQLLFGGKTPGSLENSPLSGAFSLGTFIPSLSAAFRRMHDSGRSGWGLFLPVVLLLVGVVLMVFLFMDIMGPAGRGSGHQPSLVLISLLVLCGIGAVGTGILAIIWLTRPSDPGPNAYGPPAPVPMPYHA